MTLFKARQYNNPTFLFKKKEKKKVTRRQGNELFKILEEK